MLEGQFFLNLFFINKKKTSRWNRNIIESARVRGSNKDGRDVFLAAFLKMAKDQARSQNFSSGAKGVLDQYVGVLKK